MNTDQMIPIGIQELFDGSLLNTDLFLKIDNKCILIEQAGTKVDSKRLVNYRDHNATDVWIRRSDYCRFMQKNLTVAEMLIRKGRLSTEIQSSILAKIASSIFRNFKNSKLDADNVLMAHRLVQNILHVCTNNKDLELMIFSMLKNSDALVGHSLAVSALSIVIAQHLEWKSYTILERLGLGAFLHDIGKTGPTQNDNDHVQLGAEMLQEIPILHSDILAIARQHHEKSNGHGFPLGLSFLNIHPLARVVSVANDFINILMPNGIVSSKKPFSEVLDEIKISGEHNRNRECIRALDTLILSMAETIKIKPAG